MYYIYIYLSVSGTAKISENIARAGFVRGFLWG